MIIGLFSLLIIVAVAVVFGLERDGYVPDWDQNFQWWHLAVLAVVVWAFWHVYFGTPLWIALIECAMFVLFLGFVTGFKPGNYLFYVDLNEALKRSPRAGGYYEILILSIRTRFLNIELSRMLRAQIVHGALHKCRESKATEEEFTKAQQWLRDQDPEIDFDFKLREIREGEA